MADKLPPGVLPKPEALEKYRKPERTFQRRLSTALRLRDEEFLKHLHLATSDGNVRNGAGIEEGEVERLKGEGLYPVWHIDEAWFRNEYDRKSRKEPASPPSPSSSTPPDQTTADRPALVAQIESLRRELENERKHSEVLAGQLAIKDNQIKAANENQQQANVLMKDLHGLMANLQQRLPLPPGDTRASEKSSHADVQIHDVDVQTESEKVKGSPRSHSATRPAKKKPSSKSGRSIAARKAAKTSKKKAATKKTPATKEPTPTAAKYLPTFHKLYRSLRDRS